MCLQRDSDSNSKNHLLRSCSKAKEQWTQQPVFFWLFLLSWCTLHSSAALKLINSFWLSPFCAACVCMFVAQTYKNQVHKLMCRWKDKRRVEETEMTCNEQANGWVWGFESIEAKPKAEKHEEGAHDEWFVKTWLATCDCVSSDDGGAPQRSGAVGLMRSRLQWKPKSCPSQPVPPGIEPVWWWGKQSMHSLLPKLGWKWLRVRMESLQAFNHHLFPGGGKAKRHLRMWIEDEKNGVV